MFLAENAPASRLIRRQNFYAKLSSYDLSSSSSATSVLPTPLNSSPRSVGVRRYLSARCKRRTYRKFEATDSSRAMIGSHRKSAQYCTSSDWFLGSNLFRYDMHAATALVGRREGLYSDHMHDNIYLGWIWMLCICLDWLLSTCPFSSHSMGPRVTREVYVFVMSLLRDVSFRFQRPQLMRRTRIRYHLSASCVLSP